MQGPSYDQGAPLVSYRTLTLLSTTCALLQPPLHCADPDPYSVLRLPGVQWLDALVPTPTRGVTTILSAHSKCPS